ncbi:TauD/TfdA family dioxygenase [Actinomadura sp. GC306]|uniref:TauD/TfdA family dioxygenase n=1 Tax=Actinomadura sp. GC306 TaxID=2530367 RepID=UPI001404E0E2|nr:TauD/TfdA family dioxygenase [Actinomadura sp. GC306]
MALPHPATVELRHQGWTLLRDQPFLRADATADPHRCLGLAAGWGRPSARDGGRAAWPVRATRAGGTVSQTSGAAPLHTDAAYRERPEAGMCLFSVRPARDGGRTLLLDADTALADLPDRMLNRLRRADWSWRTPEPFVPEAPFRAAVVTLPPSGAAALRWRPDLLMCGDAEQRAAAEEFARHLARLPAVELALRPGDALILDNRRILHGRTAFGDPARMLVRVRLWTLP